jgi:hypothetical protein
MEYSQEMPIELFQTFINIFKKNGVEGTMKILNKGKKDIEIQDTYVQSVLEIVANEFSMDLNDILFDKYVRGENKYVIGFCVYYLYKDYSMNDLRKLGVFENKDFSVLSRYRQLIENLDSKYDGDALYIKTMNKLDKKIKEIKK